MCTAMTHKAREPIEPNGICYSENAIWGAPFCNGYTARRCDLELRYTH